MKYFPKFDMDRLKWYVYVNNVNSPTSRKLTTLGFYSKKAADEYIEKIEKLRK